MLKKLVWVSKLLLPAISLTISRAFRCRYYDKDEPTEIQVLLADPSIDCKSDYYQWMSVYAGLMVILFPVGVPLIWFVKLQSLKKRLQCSAATRDTLGTIGSKESTGTTNSARDNKLTIDIEDPVLSVSPLQVPMANNHRTAI